MQFRVPLVDNHHVATSYSVLGGSS